MKVSSVGIDYANQNVTLTCNKPKGNFIAEASVNNSMISFKSGNPKHLFHQISELSIFGLGAGGVGTVGNDLFFNVENFDKVIENIPLYNQDIIYVKDMKDGKTSGIKQDGVKLRRIPKNLPQNHPFKEYEGQIFTTSLQLGKDLNLADELAKPQNYNKVFILDEVATSKMAWGLEKDVPVGMYIMRKDKKMKDFLKTKGWNDDMIKKIDITFTYVDSTASMQKPYADGSYATATGNKNAKDLSVNWQGQPYPKEAKATAELLPALKEKYGFDPKFLICHDGQAMPLIQYIAEKNAEGIPYYADKVLTAYGHNLNDGYMYSLGTKDAIVALAKEGEIERILKSRQYLEALKYNREEEFLKTLLPKEILDGRGQVNAVMFPIAYGEKGYVPMFTTVSDGYYKSIVENKLVSPALHERLKNLSEKGVFRGIINVLMDPLTSGFTTEGLPEYYQKDVKLKLTNGEEIVIPKFLAFDKAKKYDLNHIREVKKHNKISLLIRLSKKLEGSQLYSDKTSQWLEKGTGRTAAVTGAIGRKFVIYGGIKDDYLKMLARGEDVPMFVNCGRGDFQKGNILSFEAWVKYVKNTGDKNSVYIFGGDMTNILGDTYSAVLKHGKDPNINGRFAVINGWTPWGSLAAAGDYAPLASRFAPCELTDLESMKKACIPIVPKVQGMDQKVFDPKDTEHAQFVNGYKGLHEYYMTEETALKIASETEQNKFIDIKNSIIKELRKDYKTKLGEDMPEDLLQKQLQDNKKYKEALQKLRDSIISDEMAESMERAIKDRNTEVAKRILKNHVDLKTTWQENGWCNPDGKSTGELVKEMHFNPNKGKNLKKGEELRLNLSALTGSDGGSTAVTQPSGLRTFMRSKGGKWAIAGLAAAAAAGIIYGISKSNKNKPVEKHLSLVV